MKNLTKIEIETYLPIFNGFYGTLFECNEEREIDYINEKREEKGLTEVDFDKIEFDYDDYRNRVARRCVSFIYNELNHVFNNKLEFVHEAIRSPKEYNFYNDSINVSINFEEEFLTELKTYLEENGDAFTTYIKERYTSYDGFMSFHSNNAQEWFDYINIVALQSNSHYLGAILEFVCENEDITDEEMAQDVVDEMYVEATNFEDLVSIDN